MATDTAPKQNDTPSTKPAEAPKAAEAKRTPKPRAKTATKSRSRTRATAKSRTRKPAARASRSEATASPRPQATAPSGGRQLFAGVIDAQEKTLTAFADYQARAAELSQIPGASAIAGVQAQLLRGATDVYVSAARSLLK
jgi:hypothetical protein